MREFKEADKSFRNCQEEIKILQEKKKGKLMDIFALLEEYLFIIGFISDYWIIM